MSAGRLAASLVRLRDALAGVRLPLELPGSADALARARGYVAQLDDYILPRLATLDAPLLAVWPGLAIALAVLGLNLLGDGLRDVLDPRLTRRG